MGERGVGERERGREVGERKVGEIQRLETAVGRLKIEIEELETSTLSADTESSLAIQISEKTKLLTATINQISATTNEITDRITLLTALTTSQQGNSSSNISSVFFPIFSILSITHSLSASLLHLCRSGNGER